ncbi:hypothetical protein GE09DRAFT_962485 [Coniochaeta sp. 2T2.1]|nr:hypothetical protein GE09DRAFT_962485 [Coniochaeta sp. 2T2.1]
MARKCTLPPRVLIPGTDRFPDDVVPAETSEEESNTLSMRAFLYDFCLVSTNRDLSKGYLSSLETVIRQSGGGHSCLAKACATISFATHGKPLNRPSLVKKARIFCDELVSSMREGIWCPSKTDTAYFKMLVMLMGIYEIVVAGDQDLDNDLHFIHSHVTGLTGLMNVDRSPLKLLHKYRQHLSITALGKDNDSLTGLLFDFDKVKREFATIASPEDMTAMTDECLALDRRFAAWQATRPREFMPTEVGKMGHRDRARPTVGYWPGNIDTYFDLSVAGLWNIFRATRLQLLSQIIQLSEGLGEDPSVHVHAAICAVDSMVASIPYHLTEDLHNFVSESASNTEIRTAGPFLGGLLLLHPLYYTLRMPFLSAEMRGYLRDCILWIGTRMGIGQATVLAEAPQVDNDYIDSACFIVWSGFLW